MLSGEERVASFLDALTVSEFISIFGIKLTNMPPPLAGLPPPPPGAAPTAAAAALAAAVAAVAGLPTGGAAAPSPLRVLQHAVCWPSDSPVLEELYVGLLRYLIAQWVSARRGEGRAGRRVAGQGWRGTAVGWEDWRMGAPLVAVPCLTDLFKETHGTCARAW
mgnify:CR=1 FL=1